MSVSKHFKITFIDSGREPQCPPDPAFPAGRDIDGSQGQLPTCQLKLPYPAPRCGAFVVSCSECSLTVAVTVAGRIDDPRTLRLACKKRLH